MLFGVSNKHKKKQMKTKKNNKKKNRLNGSCYNREQTLMNNNTSKYFPSLR